MTRALALILVAGCGDNSGLPDGPRPVDAAADGPREIDAAIDSPPPPARVDLASLAVQRTYLLAGERTIATATLAQPAPEGGEDIVIVADETALGAPSAVFVPTGETTSVFDVVGKRPVRQAVLTASAGTTSRSAVIGIGGLAVSELMTDPLGSDAGLEWIKLSNATEVAIDLSGYSIGHGRTHYTYSRIQLVGVIAPRGCFIVGGPHSSAANGNPTYSQVFNFSPNLLAGSSMTGQATGTALFDVPITALDEQRIPIDVVLCGRNNLAGLVGVDGRPAIPGCPDIESGHSVARTAEDTWSDLTTPAPGSCTPF